MINQSKTVDVTIERTVNNFTSDENDILSIEEPLEISVSFIKNGQSIEKKISVTMRTPGNDEELATGFLFTEGIIKNISDVINSEITDENKIRITLAKNIDIDSLHLERNFYTTSSCGVCGKASIEAIQTNSIYTTKKISKIAPNILYSLIDKLTEHQESFKSTGGLHASALFTIDGNFIDLKEDVGRHNALDKLIGAAFNGNKLPLNNTILLLSGRASFELIQKAGMAAIPIVAAIGAPSSLAVELAISKSIQLIGFLKKDRFNKYN